MRPGLVEVVDKTLQAILGHRDGGGVKGVGLNDVCAGIQILPVDILNYRRLGDIQDVVAQTQVSLVARELLAAIVGFRQIMGLDHRAHGAVNNDNAAFQRVDERVRVGLGIIHFALTTNVLVFIHIPG